VRLFRADKPAHSRRSFLFRYSGARFQGNGRRTVGPVCYFQCWSPTVHFPPSPCRQRR
jgi:hypothetical protein